MKHEFRTGVINATTMMHLFRILFTILILQSFVRRKHENRLLLSMTRVHNPRYGLYLKQIYFFEKIAYRSLLVSVVYNYIISRVHKVFQ